MMLAVCLVPLQELGSLRTVSSLSWICLDTHEPIKDLFGQTWNLFEQYPVQRLNEIEVSKNYEMKLACLFGISKDIERDQQLFLGQLCDLFQSQIVQQ